ncbi:MAG: FG-GAP repeat protein [Magnetococcales bacterium]|nr:FG-GAP repeat protein [Magnetococcales bacterium]
MSVVAPQPVPASVIALSSLNGSNGFRLDGVAAGDISGQSVSSAGDVNGDGYDDLIVGASDADHNGLGRSGSSYVVFGKTSGFNSSIDLSSLDGSTGFRLDGAAAGDETGFSNSAGDINGDGIDDLIIGAVAASDWAGSSYVVFGKSSGFSSSVNLSSLNGSNGFRLVGEQWTNWSGYSICSAGDVNGDGFDDLIVGAKGVNSYAGSSYVVFGKASGFSSTIYLSGLDGSTGFRLNGAVAHDESGFSVSSGGDVNGDGYADLIVGAWGADPNGLSSSGSSYVVFGSSSVFSSVIALSGLDGSTGFRLDGALAGDNSGLSVSTAGDVNGDGYADLIVGARWADPNGLSQSGSSYVVFGSSSVFNSVINLSSLDGSIGFRLDGAMADDNAGISVSSAGDVNGDGFDDLMVGAFQADPNGTDSGSIYVLFGKSSGFTSAMNLSSLNGSTGFRLDGTAAGDQAGVSIRSVGDVNGDGFDDLIVGARRADPGGLTDAGSSYILFGSNSTSSVTFLGTSGADTLTGTVAAESFVSGGGNDTMTGGGGADVFHGGEGNDTITVSDLTYQLVDGGIGTDTLALSGAGMTLTLANERGRIESIETINLTGAGNNTLVLTDLDLLNLSDSSNTLTVDGDAGDTVRGGTGWTDGGISGGYHLYSKGQAQIKVATTVTFCQGDPLVLDLDGNGIRLTAKEAGIHFDMNGDGIADPTGWIGHGDGLLVWDRNGNGKIDGMQEVISEHSSPNATSSLAALATLDSNHDSKIDINDTAFAHLQVWGDQKLDGVADIQELHSLAQLGITSLGLSLDQHDQLTINGNTVTGFATITYADGHHGNMAEVQLDFVPAMQSEPFDATSSPSATQDDSASVMPPSGLATELLNWDGVALQREGDTVKLVGNDSSLDLTNLLANKALASTDHVDMRGAGNNAMNVHDFLDFSGSDHPLVISGDAGDVVNVQHAINTVLGANTTVVVDGVSHATDSTGHTIIGADSFVVHQTVDGLHTVLVDDHVVVNFLR